MEKKSSISPPVGVSPSGCCGKLLHAFHLQPTLRRLPFRQLNQVETPSPPAPVPPNPHNPTPQKQEIPATHLPVQSKLQDEQQHQKLPPLQPQQKEVQRNPSKVSSKVENVASAKAPQAPPPPPPAYATKVNPGGKSIEGAKTRKGFNQKVDDYINRTKNRMKSIGSNVGRTATKVKE